MMSDKVAKCISEHFIPMENGKLLGRCVATLRYAGSAIARNGNAFAKLPINGKLIVS
jgi:hypothetical protein